MEDIVPVLVTRNLAAESLATDVTDPALMKRRLYIDEAWKTPLGDKGVIVIRKGGAIYNCRARNLTYGNFYNNQTFQTAIRGSQDLRLGYLTPTKEVNPSEALYQACTMSGSNPRRGYWYYWMKDGLRLFVGLEDGLKYALLAGFFTGVVLFIIVLFYRPLITPWSLLGVKYWFLLWLTVMAYLVCVFLFSNLYWAGKMLILPVLVMACFFQIWGCLYMVAWKKRTGNLEVYQKAFDLMLKAPFIAFLILFLFPYCIYVINRLF
jgi:hypothetical protein